MKEYCFGIDVGGTTVKMGLFRTDGTLLDKWEIPTRTENGGEAILPDIAASALGRLEKMGLTKEMVEGIGIDVPGPINEEGVVPHTANLGWGYKEVTRELEELTGLKCRAGNDANVARSGRDVERRGRRAQKRRYGDAWHRRGRRHHHRRKNCHRSQRSGRRDRHIHVDDHIPGVCGCGNHGCLEQVASANGIVRLARWMMEEKGEIRTSIDTESMSSKDIWDAVKAGDAFAMEVAERFGKYLGLALANIASTVDPEVFVIGGGVSKAGQVVLDYIKKYYVQYTFRSCRDARFVLAALGNDAGIYGSAKLVIDAA